MQRGLYQKQGENIFSKNAKVSAELLTLTYGAFVQKLVRENEDPDEVNSALEKMGYNMGTRMVDEFFAKSGSQTLCQDFRETADVIAK